MIIIIIITIIIPYCDNQNSTRGEIMDILLIAVTFTHEPAGNMAQWVQAFSDKINDLNSVSHTHMV